MAPVPGTVGFFFFFGFVIELNLVFVYFQGISNRQSKNSNWFKRELLALLWLI